MQSTSVHPTASVHSGAHLAEGVSVGAFAIVEEGARIGPGCVIHPHAFIGAHVVMGEENTIGYGAVIGGDPQDLAFDPSLESRVVIGSRNRIREHCTIHRGTAEGSATVVGDDCFLMVGAHLAHNAKLGNRVILANNVMLGGHAEVQDRAFVGGGAAVHQFVRIGTLAICQGNSAFSKNLPPYTIGYEVNKVAGLNMVGLRRAGLDAAQRADVKAAFDLFYRKGLNTTQALAASRERDWIADACVFWDFIASAGKRGTAALVRGRESGGE